MQIVNLAWDAAPPPSTGTVVTGHNVYRSTDGGVNWQRLNPSPITGTTYTDNIALAGTIYTYTVRTSGLLNGGGVTESANSNLIVYSVPLTTHLSQPVTNFASSCLSATLMHFTWGVAPGANIYLFRMTDAGGNLVYSIDDIQQLAFDASVTAGITYTAWVHGAIASDPYGTYGPQSILYNLVCNVITPPIPPPTNLRIAFTTPVAGSTVQWNKTTTVKLNSDGSERLNLYIDSQTVARWSVTCQPTALCNLSYNWRPGMKGVHALKGTACRTINGVANCIETLRSVTAQ